MSYANMNKGQLRTAMRDAGLSYAGLNVEGMREALEAHAGATDTGNAGDDAPLNLDDDAANANAGAALADYVPSPEVVQGYARNPNKFLSDVGSLLRGEKTVDEVLPMVPPVAPVVQVPVELPPVVQPESVGLVATVVTRNTSKGVKIEKDRPVQNGVKMPSAGSLCRAVWDELERAVVAGTPYDAKGIKAHAATVGWNANNASIEYYNWRKFKGISGRSK